jgi:hypothetical protein
MGFRERYPIGGKALQVTAPKKLVMDSEEQESMRELIANGHRYTAKEIADLMDREQAGEKRLPFMILLRELYKSLADSESPKPLITAEQIERKAFLSMERTRKNFVRRVYHKNKLFALEEIRVKYPDFTAEALQKDLFKKRNGNKKKKHKPIVDLRRCQLVKLAQKLDVENLSEEDYQNTCNRIVMLQNAHNLRLPIPLTVTINKETLVYSFKWQTRESVVKSFVTLANTSGMTHVELGLKFKEMSGSPYSY